METQQDMPMTMPKVELQKEHEWLQILVGEWVMDDSAALSSGQPRCTWTETVWSLHGV